MAEDRNSMTLSANTLSIETTIPLESAQRPHISVVLNVHRESAYYRRTMLSLEDAVQFASASGIMTELVAVQDNPDAATLRWFDDYDPSVFHSFRSVVVDNSSLGLSRNDGIIHSRGRFIATYDADDLVSFNYLLSQYETALASPAKTLVFPEFVHSFGETTHLTRYFGFPHISKLSFMNAHPFISRVFAPREAFEPGYSDLKLSSGYAYEDWHFNCNALARGYGVAVAPSTTLYYRQRAGSLLKNADTLSVRQIPPSPLFEPATYLEICRDDYSRFRRRECFSSTPAIDREAFLESELCLEAARVANSIDPNIDVSQLAHSLVLTNTNIPQDVGAAYYEICEKIKGRRFSDIVLLPYITTGGGEKYLLNIFDALYSLNQTRQFLFLTGQGGVRHEWLDRLPPGSVFIDLFNSYHELTDFQRDVLTLKIIQQCAAQTTIHLKSSSFAQNFFRRYGKALGAYRSVFYRFSDQLIDFRSVKLSHGYSFSFIADEIDQLSLVVSDNERILQRDRSRIDQLTEKSTCIYTRCDPIAAPSSGGSPPKGRLLWASRLDPEKRPDLLLKIAGAMQRTRPDIHIDVWGRTVYGLDMSGFANLPNLTMRGPFTDFRNTHPGNYDAFIYTTSYDGLPNVILEAMSSSLSVIAPAVGGIPEVVIDRSTGVLLHEPETDDELVAAYVDAVQWLYEEPDRMAELGRRAFDFVQARHGYKSFVESVTKAFQPDQIQAPEEHHARR